MSKLYDAVFRSLTGSNVPEQEKREILKTVFERKKAKTHILITGDAGFGKSSTISALFNTEKAKIQTSGEAQTVNITQYEFDHLTLWEIPCFKDGPETGIRHGADLKELLMKKDEAGELLIDIVLVISDGSKDMEISFEFISKIIAPCLLDNRRLIVGINRIDQAQKGRNWNHETGTPDATLMRFLKKNEKSIGKRIKKDTGLTVTPVSYAAGFKEEGKPQEPSYNLSKLLLHIIQSIPEQKRLNIADYLNEDKAVWTHNDEMENYGQKIDEILAEGILTALFMNRDFCQSRKGSIWDTQMVSIDSLLE